MPLTTYFQKFPCMKELKDRHLLWNRQQHLVQKPRSFGKNKKLNR